MKVLVNDTEQVDAPREFQPGTLTLLCQDSADSVKVQKLCPLDRKQVFVGSWNGMQFVLVPHTGPRLTFAPVADEPQPDPDADDVARLKAMDVPTLKTEAATRGVKWDAKASPETMIERIAAAAKK